MVSTCEDMNICWGWYVPDTLVNTPYHRIHVLHIRPTFLCFL